MLITYYLRELTIIFIFKPKQLTNFVSCQRNYPVAKDNQTQRFYSQVHKKIGPLFLQRETIRNLNEFLLKSH